METTNEFIERVGVGIKADYIGVTQWEDGGQKRDSWDVVLVVGDREYKLESGFHKGFGCKHGDPTVTEVLDCLRMDCQSVEYALGFEDWAYDLGYDTDSRKAEGIYQACQRMSAELSDLLGGDYEAFLETEEG